VLAAKRDTARLGKRIATGLCPGDLVLLSGPLGAGKTYLARSVLRALGVGKEISVASPTFAIVHEYSTDKGDLLHADFYRLREGARALDEEILELGLRERRYAGAILLVEWGEGSEPALGGDADLVVTLDFERAMARSNAARRARMCGRRAPGVL
jgi:tRNA threonylcarbamoyl adenosine modification protein YjeE